MARTPALAVGTVFAGLTAIRLADAQRLAPAPSPHRGRRETPVRR
jgi:hypothetical protein